MTPQAKVVGFSCWTIPTFGNRHIVPYGTLIVSDGQHPKEYCKTKGDLYTDGAYAYQYIVFRKRKYRVVNRGTMYSPKLDLELVRECSNVPCRRNGYTIRWDKTREKYNTRKDSVVYEEFTSFEDAEDWCYEN